MDSKEFAFLRKKLEKTQKEMAELLGTSTRAVNGYEQGWRKVPVHGERQVLFLVYMKQRTMAAHKMCWAVKKCPVERKKRCPAWEFQAGDLCWFINGTVCEGSVQRDWDEKMKICRDCEMLQSLLNPEPGHLL